jgi:hypothetical protein
MASLAGVFVGPASEARDYAPVLRFILLNCVLIFFVLVLWNFGLIQTMLDTDHTRVSLLILAIFVLTALHCFYQTAVISRELNAARKASAVLAAEGVKGLRLEGTRAVAPSGAELEPGVLTSHVVRLIVKARNSPNGRVDQTLLLRGLADQLRAREKLGWFVSEALLRLALLGTAIGFILMLIPITEVNSFDTETLRTALSGMTGGMAIALNVTVTGIATALALKLEYYLLDGAVAELFHTITEVTEVQVVPALERADVRE